MNEFQFNKLVDIRTCIGLHVFIQTGSHLRGSTLGTVESYNPLIVL